MFVLALALAVSGGAAAALISALPLVGVSLCAGAALMLVLGLALFSSSKKQRGELSKELSAIGCGDGDSLSTVRTHLSRAFEDELAEKELDEAKRLADEAKTALESKREEKEKEKIILTEEEKNIIKSLGR